MDLLHTIYYTLKPYFQLKVSIREVPLTGKWLAAAVAAAEEPSNFDGDNFRKSMWSTGRYRHYIMETPSGASHLIVIGGRPSRRLLEVMWAVFAAMKRSYTVFWFMSDARRLFPRDLDANGAHVGPIHVNGGYCRACQPNTIVIYRKEDALRVLIHELQHAGCLDDHSADIAELEAKTEAWAELIYAMVGAIVHRLRPEAAWAIQSGWSAAQNRRLRSEFGVVGPADYAWRYTLGKEAVWAKMGLISGAICAPTREHPASWPDSLQLGAPQLDVV
jgi:hypothetical protein